MVDYPEPELQVIESCLTGELKKQTQALSTAVGFLKR